MDKPTSKRIGAPRFNGHGRIQSKPGTLRWYKEHCPERLNNTKIVVRNTGCMSEQDSEAIAARILRWNESKQPMINNSLLKDVQAYEKRDKDKQEKALRDLSERE